VCDADYADPPRRFMIFVAVAHFQKTTVTKPLVTVMRRPNFFMVGAGKSGTTSLYTWLSDHSQIFMSPNKEPRYFATDMPELINRVATEAEYLSLFEKAELQHLAVGEASTQYIFSQDAIPNIRDFDPQARLIVTLRNPVEMAPSAHSEARFWFFEDEADFEAAWLL